MAHESDPSPDHDSPKIAGWTRLCAKSFTEAVSAQLPGSKARINLEDQLARFKIWAGNLGVSAAGNAALDHRLREEPDMRGILIMTLDKLDGQLGALKAGKMSLEPERPTHADIGSSSESSSSSSLSSDSGSSGSTSRLGLFPGSAGAPSAITQIDEINDTVTRLYRLANVIQKPSSVKENSRIEKFSDNHGDTDETRGLETYARWKINRMHPDTAPFLVDRLVGAVVFRRKKLLYRERHQSKLKQGVEAIFASPSVAPDRSSQLSFANVTSRVAAATSAQRAFKRLQGAPALSATDASSVDRLRLAAYPKSMAMSQLTTTAVTQREHLDVPQPPKVPAGSSMAWCPYCFRSIKRENFVQPRWTHHVLKDIDPLICIFPECDKTKDQFKTEDEWTKHMLWEHNLAYSCPSPEHRDVEFVSASKLEEHMRAQHPGTFTESQLPMIIQRCGKPRTDIFAKAVTDREGSDAEDTRVCPLCPFTALEAQNVARGTPKTGASDRDPGFNAANARSAAIQSHIARHLEAIALLSLPEQEDAESVASNERPEQSERQSTYQDDAAMPSIEFSDTDQFEPETDDTTGPELDVPKSWTEVFQAIGRTAKGTYVDQELDPALKAFEKLALERASKEETETASNSADKSDVSIPNPLRDAVLKGYWNAAELILQSGNIDLNQRIDRGRTVLAIAVVHGKEKVVSFLIALDNVDVNLPDNDSRAPLHMAVVNHHLEILKMLVALEERIEPNKLDAAGQTPLMLAAMQGSEDMLEILLEKTKADINLVDRHGWTALSHAILNSHEGVVERLLKRKEIEVDLRDDIGRTPLMLAALEGQLNVVRWLLAHKEVDSSVHDRDRCTPLWLAAKEDHQEIVQLLLEHGVDPNAFSFQGQTALSGAASRGSVRTVRFLLDVPVDINAANKTGRSALHEAVHNGHTEVVELLLDRGAAIALLDVEGRSALFEASARGHIQILELLSRRGAQVNFKDRQGSTPMHVAAQKGFVDIVRRLNDLGTFSSARDRSGNTPLSIAALRGDLKMVKALLDSGGSELEIKNDNGDTPLVRAASAGHNEVVTYLLEYGAHPNGENEEHETALDLAAQNGHRETVSRLLQAGASAEGLRGMSSLHRAARKGHQEVVTLLLDAGAKVNQLTPQSDNALTSAASAGHYGVVALLLEAGADIRQYDSKNLNALSIAAMTGHESMVKLLIFSGATPHIFAIDQPSPLMWAAIKCHENIVTYLLVNGADPGVRFQSYSAFQTFVEDIRFALLQAAIRGDEKIMSVLLLQGSPEDLGLEWLRKAMSQAFVQNREGVEQQLRRYARDHGITLEIEKEEEQEPPGIDREDISAKTPTDQLIEPLRQCSVVRQSLTSVHDEGRTQAYISYGLKMIEWGSYGGKSAVALGVELWLETPASSIHSLRIKLTVEESTSQAQGVRFEALVPEENLATPAPAVAGRLQWAITSGPVPVYGTAERTTAEARWLVDEILDEGDGAPIGLGGGVVRISAILSHENEAFTLCFDTQALRHHLPSAPLSSALNNEDGGRVTLEPRPSSRTLNLSNLTSFLNKNPAHFEILPESLTSLELDLDADAVKDEETSTGSTPMIDDGLPIVAPSSDRSTASVNTIGNHDNALVDAASRGDAALVSKLLEEHFANGISYETISRAVAQAKSHGHMDLPKLLHSSLLRERTAGTSTNTGTASTIETSTARLVQKATQEQGSSKYIHGGIGTRIKQFLRKTNADDIAAEMTAEIGMMKWGTFEGKPALALGIHLQPIGVHEELSYLRVFLSASIIYGSAAKFLSAATGRRVDLSGSSVTQIDDSELHTAQIDGNSIIMSLSQVGEGQDGARREERVAVLLVHHGSRFGLMYTTSAGLQDSDDVLFQGDSDFPSIITLAFNPTADATDLSIADLRNFIWPEASPLSTHQSAVQLPLFPQSGPRPDGSAEARLTAAIERVEWGTFDGSPACLLGIELEAHVTRYALGFLQFYLYFDVETLKRTAPSFMLQTPARSAAPPEWASVGPHFSQEIAKETSGAWWEFRGIQPQSTPEGHRMRVAALIRHDGRQFTLCLESVARIGNRNKISGLLKSAWQSNEAPPQRAFTPGPGSTIFTAEYISSFL